MTERSGYLLSVPLDITRNIGSYLSPYDGQQLSIALGRGTTGQAMRQLSHQQVTSRKQMKQYMNDIQNAIENPNHHQRTNTLQNTMSRMDTLVNAVGGDNRFVGMNYGDAYNNALRTLNQTPEEYQRQQEQEALRRQQEALRRQQEEHLQNMIYESSTLAFR